MWPYSALLVYISLNNFHILSITDLIGYKAYIRQSGYNSLAHAGLQGMGNGGWGMGGPLLSISPQWMPVPILLIWKILDVDLSSILYDAIHQ